MYKYKRIGAIGVLFLMLIGVRILAQNYFYDPLITYYQNDYLYMDIPKLSFTKFWGFLLLRYFLNMGLSLIIIYLTFLNKKVMAFSIRFYVLALLVLSLLFWALLEFDLNLGYRLTFYIRRFLIHPVFLIILLPAFYYQKLNQRKTN